MRWLLKNHWVFSASLLLAVFVVTWIQDFVYRRTTEKEHTHNKKNNIELAYEIYHPINLLYVRMCSYGGCYCCCCAFAPSCCCCFFFHLQTRTHHTATMGHYGEASIKLKQKWVEKKNNERRFCQHIPSQRHRTIYQLWLNVAGTFN